MQAALGPRAGSSTHPSTEADVNMQQAGAGSAIGNTGLRAANYVFEQEEGPEMRSRQVAPPDMNMSELAECGFDNHKDNATTRGHHTTRR